MIKEQLQSKKETIEERLQRIEKDGANETDIPALIAEVKRLREEWHGLHEVCSERARANEVLREALREADIVLKHSCNIEYGNESGCERCARCKVLKALERWRKNE